MGDSTNSVNNLNRNAGTNRPIEKGTRPASAPKGDKDFKKILNERTEEDDENEQSVLDSETKGTSNRQALLDSNESVAQDSGEAEYQQTMPKPKQKLSLFDLSSSKNVDTPKKSDSPFGLFSKTSIKPKNPEDESLISAVDEEKPHVENEDIEFTSSVSTNKKSQIDEDTPNTFAAIHEKSKDSGNKESGSKDAESGFNKGAQPDPSYGSALTNQQISINHIEQKGEAVVNIDMQKLIDKLVAQVSEMRQTDRTDTTVVLKDPPMFAGASLVITSFDSARGQFNLSFENLSQMAKNMLDMQVNQDSLKASLQQKGYGVHIIVTTTQIETPIVTETTNPNTKRDQQQGDNQQNRDKGQQGKQR